MHKINLNKKVKYLFVILLLLFVSAPVLVIAATQPNPAPDFFVNIGDNTFKGIIMKAIGWILPLAGLIAVLFVIIGGFQYVMSGVDEEMAEKGKKTLKNAIIGVVIIVLSWVIVAVVSSTLARGR